MVNDALQSDEQLLKSFVEGRSQDSFAQLVRRHGPMVLGVCRRVARQTEDAEDAFQATFLVLARRAVSVSPALLPNWLHGVAYRTALKARTSAGRRRGKEHYMAQVPDTIAWPKAVDRELIELLDLAISTLPAKYRAAVILCDLQQQTRREAAATLRIPEGTLSSRLAAGRNILAGRLRKRRVTLSVSALGATLTSLSRAAPTDALVVSTAQAAVRFCAGGAAGLIPASAGAVTLAEGVLKMMVIKQFACGLVGCIAAASLIIIGAAVYGDQKARQEVRKALEGVWIVESVEDHADVRDAKGYQVIFKKDKFTFKPSARQEQEFAGRYEIDPNKGPQILDLIADKDGEPRRALFDLKNDELRICINEEPDGERPDRFVSEKRGKNDLLMILKREKPGVR
jgi:RNA polymerase sigma factor (sigma-70 family)